MRVLSSEKTGGTVQEALKKVSFHVNEELSKTPGSIAEFKPSINVGVSGASARLIVIVDEKKIRSKNILWVNEGGSSREEALSRAKEKINSEIKNISGEVADSHIEFVSPPLPKRVYVTIILGVNEKVPEKIGKLNTEERRARIFEILSLLGNEAKALNISEISKIFKVSRDTIYKDLEKLGFNR